MIGLTRLLRSPQEALARLSRRLGANENGAVAVQFAFLAIPLALLVFGLLDMNRVSLQRRHLQDALDASALIAARAGTKTDAELDVLGDATLAAELAGLGIPLSAASSTFANGAENSVVA
ncbi:TadE/TadG family type IV pilus assembly protein, partial [Caulobacter sp. HMWF009]|uniref:TadE/TadG family type IV pilus assembly protein n=1 Tax=Caulobacter sp. HMWF009 TaxID=2056846 RepID=UPI0018EE4E17